MVFQNGGQLSKSNLPKNRGVTGIFAEGKVEIKDTGKQNWWLGDYFIEVSTSFSAVCLKQLLVRT